MLYVAVSISIICIIIFILYLCLSSNDKYEIKNKYSINNKMYNINKTLKIPEKHSEELVIVYCTENIDWVVNYINNYDLITIYNKCGKNLKFNSDKIKIVNLENIGSCDYGFLTYIIDRYKNLPDFVEFTKGALPPKKIYNNCLPCTDNMNNFSEVLNFSLKNDYSFEHNKSMDNISEWVKSDFNNLGDWLKDFNKLSPELFTQNACNIIYGGQFGVTKYQIFRNSLDTYKKLRNYQKYPREEIDHYIERIWRPLLCRPKFFLVIVAIFKNEKTAMKEWLEHYLKQGVEHFYLIDNDSTDDWIVETLNAPITVISDPEKFKQIEHYNKYLDTVKINSEWVMVVDLDEFVYARKGQTISTTIKNYDEDIDIIKLRWKMFGSNGNNVQPNSIIDGFTGRKKMEITDKNGSFDYYKTIIKTRILKKFDVHNHKIYGDCKEIIEPYIMSEEALLNSKLQLNHYAIQSKKWFLDVKNTRGDVLDKINDEVRNLEYFKKYDNNDIYDNELSILNSNISFKKEVNIPYIINNYQNIIDLKLLLSKLNYKGYRNIIVLDNNSTDIDLLEYYSSYDFNNIARVIKLSKNFGNDALFETGLSKGLDNNWYIYNKNISLNEYDI